MKVVRNLNKNREFDCTEPSPSTSASPACRRSRRSTVGTPNYTSTRVSVLGSRGDSAYQTYCVDTASLLRSSTIEEINSSYEKSAASPKCSAGLKQKSSESVRYKQKGRPPETTIRRKEEETQKSQKQAKKRRLSSHDDNHNEHTMSNGQLNRKSKSPKKNLDTKKKSYEKNVFLLSESPERPVDAHKRSIYDLLIPPEYHFQQERMRHHNNNILFDQHINKSRRKSSPCVWDFPPPAPPHDRSGSARLPDLHSGAAVHRRDCALVSGRDAHSSKQHNTDQHVEPSSSQHDNLPSRRDSSGRYSASNRVSAEHVWDRSGVRCVDRATSPIAFRGVDCGVDPIDFSQLCTETNRDSREERCEKQVPVIREEVDSGRHRPQPSVIDESMDHRSGKEVVHMHRPTGAASHEPHCELRKSRRSSFDPAADRWLAQERRLSDRNGQSLRPPPCCSPVLRRRGQVQPANPPEEPLPHSVQPSIPPETPPPQPAPHSVQDNNNTNSLTLNGSSSDFDYGGATSALLLCLARRYAGLPKGHYMNHEGVLSVLKRNHIIAKEDDDFRSLHNRCLESFINERIAIETREVREAEQRAAAEKELQRQSDEKRAMDAAGSCEIETDKPVENRQPSAMASNSGTSAVQKEPTTLRGSTPLDSDTLARLSCKYPSIQKLSMRLLGQFFTHDELAAAVASIDPMAPHGRQCSHLSNALDAERLLQIFNALLKAFGREALRCSYSNMKEWKLRLIVPALMKRFGDAENSHQRSSLPR